MRSNRGRFGCVTFALGCLAVGTMLGRANAQCEIRILNDSSRFDSDLFGWSIAVDGDVLIIGAPEAEANDIGIPGAVVIFRFNLDSLEWVQEIRLVASDAGVNQEFGWAVDICGDVAIVGADRDDDACPGDDHCFSGSAYIFRYDGSTWNEEAKLVPSDTEAFDRFGFAVAIEGDVAVIGAPRVGAGTDVIGSTYVFNYDKAGDQWIEVQELTFEGPAIVHNLGSSLALSRDRLIAGAPGPGKFDELTGVAFAYRFDGKAWILDDIIQSSDGALEDRFGHAVAMSNDLAIISARGDDDNGSSSGSAYVFQYDPDSTQWNEIQKLHASDGAAGDEFGSSLAMSDDLLVVGAVGDDDNGNFSGSTYVLEKSPDGWTEQAKLLASDGQNNNEFGRSAALQAGSLIIGAPDRRQAYLFTIDGSDCNDNGTIDQCDILDGTSNDANDNGIPDECECPWDLDANGSVGASDLLSLLVSWGPCKGCPADFDRNGSVGASDLLALLVNWGPCS